MGTSGQKIRRFQYIRCKSLEQQIFASRCENLLFQFITRQGFLFTFPAAAEQNRHRNMPTIRANLCACFTCSCRSASIVQEQDGQPLHEQVGCPEGASFWLWVSNRDEQHPCWVSGYVSNCNHIYTSIMPPFWRICFLISSSQIQPRKSYASTLKFVIISVAL